MRFQSPIVKDKGNTEALLTLTDRGRKKAEEFSEPEGLKFKVLSTLQESSTPMSLRELSTETKIEYNRAREVCKFLLRTGDIRKVS